MKTKPRFRRILLLGSLFVSIAAYGYFHVLIDPLETQSKRLKIQIQKTAEQADASASELRKLIAAEEAENANAALDLLAERLMTAVAHNQQVTCPEAVEKALKERGIEDFTVRLALLAPFRAMPDLVIGGWNITVPAADALRLGEAIADIENAFPMGQISELSMQANGATGTVDTTISLQVVAYP